MKEVLDYLDKIGVDPFKRIESSKGGNWSVLGILKDFKSEFNFIDSSLKLEEKVKPNFLEWKNNHIDIQSDRYYDKRNGMNYKTSDELSKAYINEMKYL